MISSMQGKRSQPPSSLSESGATVEVLSFAVPGVPGRFYGESLSVTARL